MAIHGYSHNGSKTNSSLFCRQGLTQPKVGKSGGSVAALATCGFVSDLAHPSTSLLWATLVIVAYRATTIKPKVHNKPKLDDYRNVDK